MEKIALVKYNAGNLTSVAAAIKTVYPQAELIFAETPEQLASATRIVFPGVGAAQSAMQHLTSQGLISALLENVRAGKPFLGICLGYQLMFDSSQENDGVEALHLIPGQVESFQEVLGSDCNLKIPHMGWNSVLPVKDHYLFTDIPPDTYFYFVHSYYPVVKDQTVQWLTTDYGVTFTAGIACNNYAGVQFHPEKSGRVGLKMLSNFCRWKP